MKVDKENGDSHDTWDTQRKIFFANIIIMSNNRQKVKICRKVIRGEVMNGHQHVYTLSRAWRNSLLLIWQQISIFFTAFIRDILRLKTKITKSIFSQIVVSYNIECFKVIYVEQLRRVISVIPLKCSTW